MPSRASAPRPRPSDTRSGTCTWFAISLPLSGAGGAGHEVGEPLEEIVRIVRTRGCLRVVLHADPRQLAMPQAFARAVVQVDVARLPAGRRHRRRIHGEVVVLRGD